MSPIPWYVSAIEEHGPEVKYLIRSEDRNQFPTWIAELSVQGGEMGKVNADFIVKAVNHHAELLEALQKATSRIEWAVDLMQRIGEHLGRPVNSSTACMLQSVTLKREANILAESLGPLYEATAAALNCSCATEKQI